MAKSGGTGSSGENINHFHSVRIRVVGEGNLEMKFTSLDNIIEQDLQAIIMQATTYIQPTKLSNFKSQRAAFELRTTEIDEYFKINRIVLFVKPLFTSYPQ